MNLKRNVITFLTEVKKYAFYYYTTYYQMRVVNVGGHIKAIKKIVESSSQKIMKLIYDGWTS